jgi:hypothetical protein
MEAGGASNRTLELRAMDGLRKRLADRVERGGNGRPASGLPSVDSLAAADAWQLREVGAGRLAAVAVVVPDAVALQAVIRLVEANVRRTDLLLARAEDTLLVLAPGLDPLGGQSLIARLEEVLHAHLADTPAGRPGLGAAYQSPLSLTGWDIAQLADEARRRALRAAEPVERVA